MSARDIPVDADGKAKCPFCGGKFKGAKGVRSHLKGNKCKGRSKRLTIDNMIYHQSMQQSNGSETAPDVEAVADTEMTDTAQEDPFPDCEPGNEDMDITDQTTEEMLARRRNQVGLMFEEIMEVRQQLQVETSTEEEDEAAINPPDEPNPQQGGGDPNFFQKPNNFGSDYLWDEIQGGDDYQSTMYNLKHHETMLSLDKELLCDIELLRILRGLPLQLFEMIRSWRYRCEHTYKHKMDEGYPTKKRSTVVQNIEKHYKMEGCRPIVKRVKLPNTKRTTDIVTFSFAHQLHRMLTDPEVMDPKNLVVDTTNNEKFFASAKPCNPQEGQEEEYYDDVNTGSVFASAHARLCKDKEKDVLVGLVGGLDKSFVDKKGKLTLEPLMITLPGLFNRQFRNSPRAWFPIGYVPNLDHICSKEDALKKLKDYHYCLRVIMSEMIHYQRIEGGIKWKFAVNNQYIETRLHIPLFFIIGDTEGHDRLAGRKMGRGHGTRPCRFCNIKQELMGDPFHLGAKKTKRMDIKRLRDRGVAGTNELEELGYRNIIDAFDMVVFADPELGIHGATPAEALHANELGPLETAICGAFCLKRVKPKKKNGNQEKDKRKKRRGQVTTDAREEEEIDQIDVNEDDQGTAWEYAALDDAIVFEHSENLEDYSARGIFGKNQCIKIDQRCKELNEELRWQSCTDRPRTTFPTGISSLSKMTANERTGVLLMLVIILVMDGVHYDERREIAPQHRFGPDEEGYLTHTMKKKLQSSMIKHASLLLMFNAYLRLEKIPSAWVPIAHEFTPYVIEGVIRTFPRSEGMGHATPKTHFNTHHMIPETYRNGSLQNSNSSRLESNHGDHIKDPGKNTQLRASCFGVQVGNQVHYKSCIDRATCDHPLYKEERSKEKFVKKSTVSPAIWTIDRQGVFRGTNKKKDVQQEMLSWKDSAITGAQLIHIVQEKILKQLCPEDRVTIHVRAKVGGVTYHMNPCFGADGRAKQHWAMVETQVRDATGEMKKRLLGMHLLCILYIPTKPSEPIIMDAGTTIHSPDYYFLAHTLTTELSRSGTLGYGKEWDSGTLAESNAFFMHMAHKQVEEEGGIRRQSIVAFQLHRIKEDLIGLRDPSVNRSMDQWYYFIDPPRNWPALYIEAAREHEAYERAKLVQEGHLSEGA